MWRVALAVVLVLMGSSTRAAAQAASQGERVYKRHCARCHEGTMPRMPSRDALRKFPPEEIDISLSSFGMRRQAARLSPAERRAVAEFLSGRPAGSYRAPLDVIAKQAYCGAGAPGRQDGLAEPAWNGWGADLQNTRLQSAKAAGLSASDVPRLRIKWAFGFPGVSASGSQTTVAGGRAYVGSRNGLLYALNARTGCIEWVFEAEAGIRSAPSVGPVAGPGSGTVFFGDAHAQVYAVDAANGKLRWKTKVDGHLDAMITGAPALHAGRLYVPVSSLEEGSGAMPTYECCTFRGSLVSLDAASGRQLWKTYTITDPPKRTAKNSIGTQLWGPSGAAIWSAPTLDPDRNRLYVTTGDSYSNPVALASDAIMALAMDSGRILWVKQTLPGDAWNAGCLETTPEGRVNCPDVPGPDRGGSLNGPGATVAGGMLYMSSGYTLGFMPGNVLLAFSVDGQ